MSLPPLSYAQRFEDLHLARALGDVTNGFYVDVGAGHPVYDNVSFAFYLAGWRGICVEPNPALAALNRATRRRDTLYEGLAGAAPGNATLYLQREFHGLSTTVPEHAEIAAKEVGHSAEALMRPVTTLAALCEHAPAAYEFLKVDVEGAEADVLRGADFSRHRPKIIVVEAIKPFTLAPAWGEWEPLLARHGYAYVWDDELNRYYVAEEARGLADRLAEGPKWYADRPQVSNFKAAAEDETHPDHRLARLLADAGLTAADMATLPLTHPEKFLVLLTAGLDTAALTAPATETTAAAVSSRVFGATPYAADLHTGETVRDVYARIIDSDRFRTACGRICASYAW
jgi:FkbM family methyltransferase